MEAQLLQKGTDLSVTADELRSDKDRATAAEAEWRHARERSMLELDSMRKQLEEHKAGAAQRQVPYTLRPEP